MTREKVNLPDKISTRSMLTLRESITASRRLKLGMKLAIGQRIERFELSVSGEALSLVADGAPFPITRELEAAFGVGSEEQWVGYLAGPARTRDFDAIDMTLAVANFHIPRHAFQDVPIVLGYAEEPFESHGYLLGVHMLSGIDSLGIRASLDDITGG